MREGLFEHHRLDPVTLVAATLGAGPVAQGILGPVPQGYTWYIESVAFSVAGANHTAEYNMAVTVDDPPLPASAVWDRAGLELVIPAAIRGSSPPGIAWYAQAGHFIRHYLSGGTLAAGDVVTVTTQIAVHQLDPHFLMSPEDAAQVKSAHERMSAELNMDAVGQRAV